MISVDEWWLHLEAVANCRWHLLHALLPNVDITITIGKYILSVQLVTISFNTCLLNQRFACLVTFIECLLLKFFFSNVQLESMW